MFFPLFTAPEAAIDAYCRRKLDGFTMVPQNPLPESSFPPSNSIPSLRLRLRAYRAPIAAGITTAGVAGAIIFVNTAQPPISSEPKDNQNIIVINDSTLVNKEIGDSTLTASATVVASSTPYRRSVATKHSAGMIKEDDGEENTTSKSDTLTTTESGHPPVVVKKVRRTNRTIVIQDSLKR